MKTRRRASIRGLTLLEAMVSIGVLALIGSLIYGAFDGMSRSRKGISGMNDRYHQGRAAIQRMSREIQAAFVSKHGDYTNSSTMISQQVRKTGFIGQDEGSFDRLDFTSFAHRRLSRDAHESDQCEIGYFGARNEAGTMDLVRREDKYLDMEPQKGGVVNVLVEDVQSFDIQYFDDTISEWVDTWDTTQVTGQPWRLPQQVLITLVLNGGPGGKPIVLRSRVSPAMQLALDFAN
ncbi:type II secretion system protein GspJ [Polyangium sp. y55x31]|uniref:type II secretion system protein GspJ n=1 Tax=Polyangium sp. y55x31 TaxID=3042688 RepID=UPI0024824729|nr:type II secretion system protein GspJ [Polyangium sp. y55x31]MDI1484783.1 type II secretion system protein GspJ [Polyangium sp. y55x31]